MSSVSYYKRKDSPYYFLRIYKSKLEEPDPKKRRSSKSTKIKVNRDGEREVKQKVKQLNASYVKNEQKIAFGLQLKKSVFLSVGSDKFLKSKPDLADKTIEVYKSSVSHMIKACNDKLISDYFDSDYTDLINYFNKREMGDTSKSIFTRHLSAMWNYFIKQEWTEKNIIIKVKSTKTNSTPIPFKDMQKLLVYYKTKNIGQYYLVYFMLLTGVRPSSAIFARWEHVKFDHNYIQIRNVKAKKDFLFPLHSELKEMLLEMKPKKKGSIFGYETPPKFFGKDCEKLFLRGNIGYRYTLSQLRNTFSSWLANKGVNMGTLKTLLDHTDQRVTAKHYTEFDLDYLRKEIEQVNFKEKSKKKR